MRIHPTAVVDPHAELGANVQIGPFCVVGPGVVLHDEVVVGSHVVLEGPCELGARTRVFPFAAIGHEAQDRKFRGEPSRVVIGARCTLREGVTVHRGTAGGDGVTRIGDDVLLMAQSHVAHDCVIGNDVVLANSAALAGHVVVGEGAVLGGLAAVHQFARIGRLAMVGGGAMVAQDVPPFCVAQGDRARLFGLNLVGLRRAGVSPERIEALRAAYRALFLAGEPRASVLARLSDIATYEVAELLAAVRGSRRGTCRAAGDLDDAGGSGDA